MKILAFCLTLSFITFNTSDIDWLSVHGKKKLDRTISKIWKDKTIIKKEINIPIEEQKKMGLKIRDQSLYKIIVDNQIEAYLFLDSKRSKFDLFDYMVLLNNDLSIRKVNILVYREDYGGEICSPTFLKQFAGKSYNSKLKLGEDVQGISGATISCRQSVSGVKIITKKAKILQERGYL